MKQQTTEWHQARAGKITASRFRNIMSSKETKSYREYIQQLAYERRTGEVYDSGFQTDAMLRGILLEPQARAWYQISSKLVVIEAGFDTHGEYSFIGASADGYIHPDGLIEIKCPLTSNYLDIIRKNEVPSCYRWQVQGQMLVCNRMWVDFVAYHPDYSGHIIRVMRNQSAIVRLLHRCVEANREIDALVGQARRPHRAIGTRSTPLKSIERQLPSEVSRKTTSIISYAKKHPFVSLVIAYVLLRVLWSLLLQ